MSGDMATLQMNVPSVHFIYIGYVLLLLLLQLLFIFFQEARLELVEDC